MEERKTDKWYSLKTIKKAGSIPQAGKAIL